MCIYLDPMPRCRHEQFSSNIGPHTSPSSSRNNNNGPFYRVPCHQRLRHLTQYKESQAIKCFYTFTVPLHRLKICRQCQVEKPDEESFVRKSKTTSGIKGTRRVHHVEGSKQTLKVVKSLGRRSDERGHKGALKSTGRKIADIRNQPRKPHYSPKSTPKSEPPKTITALATNVVPTVSIRRRSSLLRWIDTNPSPNLYDVPPPSHPMTISARSRFRRKSSSIISPSKSALSSPWRMPPLPSLPMKRRERREMRARIREKGVRRRELLLRAGKMYGSRATGHEHKLNLQSELGLLHSWK